MKFEITGFAVERDHGLGKHMYVLGARLPEHIQAILKLFFIYNIGYCTSTTAIKLAILAFYRRIFPVKPMQPILLIGLLVVMAYFIGTLFGNIFHWYGRDSSTAVQR